MAKWTVKNGRMILSAEAAKEDTAYQGKRKVQGEKAAEKLDAKTAPKG